MLRFRAASNDEMPGGLSGFLGSVGFIVATRGSRDWARMSFSPPQALVSAGYHVLRRDVADEMADVEAAVARVGAEVARLR